ncbi:MAG: molybdopterin-dependent oxidoreductase [Candidatus Bathyarchaeia archaeon]
MSDVKMSVVKPVTCPICGCVCDDIEITVEDGKIKKVKNGCVLSISKFLNYNCAHRLMTPMIRENGELVPVSLEKAVDKAAEILVNAKYPILHGWSSTTSEAIGVGVKLTEEVGGVYDNCAVNCHGPSLQGVQHAGVPGSTLGQIRHRADLVIYWGANPMVSHPRQLSRYTVGKEGKFASSDISRRFNKKAMQDEQQKDLNEIFDEKFMMQHYPTKSAEMNGAIMDPLKIDRKMIVVDIRMTPTAELADYFLKIEPNRDFELFQALRVLVKGGELDVDSVAGVPVDKLEEIADVMISCRFGVLFWGLGLTMTLGKYRNTEAAIRLVRDLNQRAKFVMMPVRGHYNVAGSNVVACWLTGYPHSVDMSTGYPRYNPGETSITDILIRGENDASLILGADPVSNYPKKLCEGFVNNPLIVIDPHKNISTLMADVAIPVAFSGIEASGTAYRMDNVPITLKKVVEPPAGILTDAEILTMILAKVKELKQKQQNN